MSDFTDFDEIHVSFEEHKNINMSVNITHLFSSINILHKILSILEDKPPFFITMLAAFRNSQTVLQSGFLNVQNALQILHIYFQFLEVQQERTEILFHVRHKTSVQASTNKEDGFEP
jgi:hypothetical protein